MATQRRKPLDPNALTGEDLQRANTVLWERFLATKDAAVREQIILQYAPLVKYVMGRLAISLPAILDYEDILSFGTIGLIESALARPLARPEGAAAE